MGCATVSAANQTMKPRGAKQQAAALGRAIMRLETEAGTMQLEAAHAGAQCMVQHAKFFTAKEVEHRQDAAILTDLMENLPTP